jgi:hypothetical protein
MKIYQKISSKNENCLGSMFCLTNGGEENKDIDTLRYDIVERKVCRSNNFVHPKMLPPTSSSAEFHSHRCYFQIQTWL